MLSDSFWLTDQSYVFEMATVVGHGLFENRAQTCHIFIEENIYYTHLKNCRPRNAIRADRITFIILFIGVVMVVVKQECILYF